MFSPSLIARPEHGGGGALYVLLKRDGRGPGDALGRKLRDLRQAPIAAVGSGQGAEGLFGLSFGLEHTATAPSRRPVSCSGWPPISILAWDEVDRTEGPGPDFRIRSRPSIPAVSRPWRPRS